MAQEKKVAAKPADGKARKSADAHYTIVREIVRTAPNVRKLVSTMRLDDGSRVQYDSRTITELKDGTRKVDGKTYLYKDGSVKRRVWAEAYLERNSDGKWIVRFKTDAVFVNLFNMLAHGLVEESKSLAGILETGIGCGFLHDLAEGNTSDPLTDEQAAKVREFFTPDWIDAEPGAYHPAE